MTTTTIVGLSLAQVKFIENLQAQGLTDKECESVIKAFRLVVELKSLPS